MALVSVRERVKLREHVKLRERVKLRANEIMEGVLDNCDGTGRDGPEE